MLGVIGHERFMQGTVISDAVNLASRLQGLTKVYGVSLIVSNHVLFGLDDPNRYGYRFLDKVKVKGKEESVSVYEVFDADPPELVEQKKRTREAFEKGVYEYHAGNFTSAYELFSGNRKGMRPDKPLSIYAQRCRRSMKLGAVEYLGEEFGTLQDLSAAASSPFSPEA
jgi:two-component system sensor histidine kinase ChiS